MADQVTDIRSLAQGRTGPTLLALGLAILATPFAAIAIMLASVDSSGESAPVELDLVIEMALVAVLVGALVGRTIGGLAVRRRPILGMALAIATAWPAALATLPIVPGLLGRQYAAVKICIDSCSPVILGDSAGSAIAGYGLSVVVTSVYAVPAAGILLLIAWFLARRRRRWLQAVLVAAAVVALSSWSMWSGPLAAAALVAGALIWIVPYWPDPDPAALDQPVDTPVPGWGPGSS